MNHATALGTRLWHAARRQAMRPALMVFAASMSRSALAFVIVFVVAPWLGPADFGLFTTFIVAMFVAHNLIGEGFDSGVVRLYAMHSGAGSGRAPGVLGSALLLRALLVGPMLLAYWGAAAWWFDPHAAAVVRLAALTALAASCATLSLVVLQARERFVTYALLTPLVNALRLACIPLLWLAGALSLQSLIWTHALSFAVAAVIGMYLVRDDMRHPRFSLRAFRELVRFSKWTALASLSFMLQAHLAVPVLTQVKGAAQGGLYSAAATLLMVIDQLTVVLLTVKLPSTSRIETPAELRLFVRRLAPRLLTLALGLCLLLPLADTIVTAVFGPAYADSAGVMRILLPGFIATLISHPLYLVLYSLDRPQGYAASGMASFAVWSALAWWLLPVHGVVGAAWATTGARVLQALIIVAMVLHAIRHRPAALPLGGPSGPPAH